MKTKQVLKKIGEFKGLPVYKANYGGDETLYPLVTKSEYRSVHKHFPPTTDIVAYKRGRGWLDNIHEKDEDGHWMVSLYKI